MHRRAFLSTMAGGLLAAPLAAEAQQSRKVYRLGVLNVAALPASLSKYKLSLNGKELVYTYDTHVEHSDIPSLLRDVGAAGIELKDLHTTQSSLEEIFVGLVSEKR